MMVLTFRDYEIVARITNNFADYEKIAGNTNYFGVEFLKIIFYLILFVKMELFRQKERIQVIKYIYLLKKKIKMETETETEAGAHLLFDRNVCENERIGSCCGGRGAPPAHAPWISQCVFNNLAVLIQ